MRARVVSSIILLLILIILLILVHTPFFVLAISFLAATAVYELTNSTGCIKNKTLMKYGIFVSMLIPFIHRGYVDYKFIPLMAFIYLATLVLLLIRNHDEITFSEIAVSFFATLVIPQLFSIFIIFRDLSNGHGVLYILLTLCGSWISDTGAFFAGKFFGKHKLAPKISPNKTVEGFIGGVVISTASFLLMGYIYVLFSKMVLGVTVEINYILLLIMGPIVSSSGVAGDLFASVIKRQTGIKDYGNLMPGHGGILDRFDSVLFALPTLALLLYFLPPVAF